MSDDLLGQPDQDSIADQVVALFRDLGGDVAPRELAQEAIDRGILSGDLLAGITLRGAAEFCRRALKRKTEDDLPFAKPSGNKDRWKQLDLFTYDEAEALIRREADAWLADHKELQRLVDWCFLKFGRAPVVPQIAA